MSIIDIINARIQERGMPIATVARRAGICSELLARTLKGKRKLKADELVHLCMVLDLTFSNFRREHENKSMNTEEQIKTQEMVS